MYSLDILCSAALACTCSPSLRKERRNDYRCFKDSTKQSLNNEFREDLDGHAAHSEVEVVDPPLHSGQQVLGLLQSAMQASDTEHFLIQLGLHFSLQPVKP